MRYLTELEPGTHDYDPFELVHSELIIPADWGFGPGDDYYDECTCIEQWEEGPAMYWHECGPWSPSERILQTFEWKYYSPEFRDSIREHGINVQPIYIDMTDKKDLYILRNGHHRLMVAYDYGLPVRATVEHWTIETSGDIFNSDFAELPWSGD